MKDIFIDNDVAVKFATPPSSEYKQFISWLLKRDPSNPSNEAYIVLNKRIYHEYIASCGLGSSSTNIVLIVDKMISQGRTNKFTKTDIESFKRTCYKKHVRASLACDYFDKEFHLPSVMLSQRQYLISEDGNFKSDVQKFKGFHGATAISPNHIPYV